MVGHSSSVFLKPQKSDESWGKAEHLPLDFMAQRPAEL